MAAAPQAATLNYDDPNFGIVGQEPAVPKTVPKTSAQIVAGLQESVLRRLEKKRDDFHLDLRQERANENALKRDMKKLDRADEALAKKAKRLADDAETVKYDKLLLGDKLAITANNMEMMNQNFVRVCQKIEAVPGTVKKPRVSLAEFPMLKYLPPALDYDHPVAKECDAVVVNDDDMQLSPPPELSAAELSARQPQKSQAQKKPEPRVQQKLLVQADQSETPLRSQPSVQHPRPNQLEKPCAGPLQQRQARNVPTHKVQQQREQQEQKQEPQRDVPPSMSLEKQEQPHLQLQRRLSRNVPSHMLLLQQPAPQQEQQQQHQQEPQQPAKGMSNAAKRKARSKRVQERLTDKSG